jgi:hypothetical protein
MATKPKPKLPLDLTTYKAAAARMNAHPETIRKWVKLYKIPRHYITSQTVFLADDWFERLFQAGKRVKDSR